MDRIILRDYQASSVQKLRAGVAAGRRKQVLCSPTGSGKTEIACHMLDEALKKQSRSLFIVDRVVLVDQTSQRLDRYGINHGVIQAGHWRFRPYEKVQVCSAQTLERRGIPDDVQVVFVDEAHGMRRKVSEYLESTNAVVIGLTATPFTKGMGKLYEGMVNVTTTNELIAREFLAPLKIYAAKAIRTEGMKVVAGEWSEKDIEARGLEIIGDIVAEWQDKTEKHFGGPVKTIVFSATVAHGEELCRQFQAAGFNFQQISYKDGGEDHRRTLIEEFRKPDSEIHGLVSCEVFTKGFDVSDVLCGISARPYRKSLSSHIQQMGRVMRAHPGKEYGLWLDHSGNVMRFHADVEDVFENGVHEMDDGKREERAKREPTEEEREVIRCSGCGYVLAAHHTKCPSCGKERKRRTLIEQQAGEMVELDGNAMNRKTGWDEKRKFIAGLRAYAAEHGYNPGWVAHKYKSRFGVWPNDPRVKNEPAAAYEADLARWLRSQQIKWAKTRRAA
jgi:superfamily II DNA or RNA helicase